MGLIFLGVAMAVFGSESTNCARELLVSAFGFPHRGAGDLLRLPLWAVSSAAVSGKRSSFDLSETAS